MLHVEEGAGAAAVDDFVEGVGFRGVEAGVEGDVLGREVVVVGGGAVPAGLVLDVLIGGACYGRRVVFCLMSGFGFGFWGESGERRVEQ